MAAPSALANFYETQEELLGILLRSDWLDELAPLPALRVPQQDEISLPVLPREDLALKGLSLDLMVYSLALRRKVREAIHEGIPSATIILATPLHRSLVRTFADHTEGLLRSLETPGEGFLKPWQDLWIVTVHAILHGEMARCLAQVEAELAEELENLAKARDELLRPRDASTPFKLAALVYERFSPNFESPLKALESQSRRRLDKAWKAVYAIDQANRHIEGERTYAR